ncbi:hypothetical protein RUM44_012384 [Polyplax serrata]|uniref:Uncharacterized protein n=1 Tax=Polyplax serrata TaxID=468196 RepID=A0ABR1BBH7_POLSC
MSRVTIFIIKECEKNKTDTCRDEMPDGGKNADKNKASEFLADDEYKSARQRHDRAKQTGEVSVEGVDVSDVTETTLRMSTTSTATKKTHKSKDGHSKVALNKSDCRNRTKVVSDMRMAYPGSGGNDLPWLEKSQSDLNSKWTVDNSVKSDSSLKGHSYALISSESDIFPTRGGIPGNEVFTRPHTLFKSSSSSQIPSVKGNSTQSMRQLKFGGNGVGAKAAAFQQSYAPPAIGKNHCCCCSGNCSKRTNRTESSLSLSEDAETPEGLSWRRLHMSRAKLKATATTSELLSGFAMVAMVELQINKPTAVPEWLFVLFAICTTILVSVHIFALMISTYLLPNIDAVSKLHVSSLVTESPHDRMKSFIELAWAFSTILGLFLFLVEVAILCWVKFWDYSFTAAISATMIVIPVLILFVAFAIHFYHSLVVIKCKSSVYDIQELENMKRQLDNVSPA